MLKFNEMKKQQFIRRQNRKNSFDSVSQYYKKTDFYIFQIPDILYFSFCHILLFDLLLLICYFLLIWVARVIGACYNYILSSSFLISVLGFYKFCK